MLKNRNIPFGYCVVNGKYALNNSEAETVRKIFKDYIGGKSLRKIAAEIRIPYNVGKTEWNINMVCRVLENQKYTSENGYPQIIPKHEYEQALRIKAERTTYRKPTSQEKIKQYEIIEFEYKPTEEIQQMTNEISNIINSENPDKQRVETLILQCTQLKYSAISEVKL